MVRPTAQIRPAASELGTEQPWLARSPGAAGPWWPRNRWLLAHLNNDLEGFLGSLDCTRSVNGR